MKVLGIFLLFLISGCPFSKPKAKFNKGQHIEKETVYETPPHAPIPPEKYCYELHQGVNGKEVTKLELTVALDSVVGILYHVPKREDEPDGSFIGTIYDNTMLISYQYIEQGKSKTEEQVWKISNDSIFRKITEIVKVDSSQAGMKDSVRIFFAPALHKAPCI